MEKAILTEAQAEAIVRVLNDEDSFGWVLDAHSHGPKSWVNRYEGLNGMDIDALARALYIGYEIEPEEPEFLPGDDVMVNWSNGRKVHRVKKVEDDGSVTLDRDFSLNSRPNMNIVRHATPEEVYWLKTIGRKKIGDFREGDILMDTERVLFEVGHEVDKDSAGYWVKDGNISGIYPAEYFKPFPKNE